MSNQKMVRIGRENDITGRKGVLGETYTNYNAQKLIETFNSNSGINVFYILPEKEPIANSKPPVARKQFELNRGDSL